MAHFVDENDIEILIEGLKEKHSVFAMMTDTVAGIMCNAYDSVAINKIYDIKKRNLNKPLGIFVHGSGKKDIIRNIEDIVIVNDDNRKVIENLYTHWPGPLTIIFNKKEGGTIGIRMPKNKFLDLLLSKIDFDIAQTSMNIEGEEPCSSIMEIDEKFGHRLDYIVNIESESSNNSSTIVDVTGKPFLKRKGDLLIEV